MCVVLLTVRSEVLTVLNAKIWSILEYGTVQSCIERSIFHMKLVPLSSWQRMEVASPA